MLNLILPSDISEAITTALKKAGHREVGGVLLGEHVGPDEFAIREISIHGYGAIASFVRLIEDALGKIKRFFEDANHDYRRFNYVGEWHSHPSFEPAPSSTDDASAGEIAQDPSVGANFVALLVVKLDRTGNLVGTVHAYLPDGSKHRGSLTIN